IGIANNPRSLLWMARQEGKISWRDLAYLMTAGGRWRMRSVVIWIVIVIAVMHAIAWQMVGPYAHIAPTPHPPDPPPPTATLEPRELAGLTGRLGLGFFLMLSQSLEQVTRLFYGRGDLDLLKSAPVSLRQVLGLRVLSVAVTTTAMTMFIAAPFINVLVYRGG